LLAEKQDIQCMPWQGVLMNHALHPLIESLRRFADERNWQRFHSPKNLACALSVEAAELLEHFQWLSEAESQALAGIWSPTVPFSGASARRLVSVGD
jgi:hypothetical protein